MRSLRGPDTDPGFFGTAVADFVDKRDHNVAQGSSIVSGVSGRYASALFELAQEMKATDAVGARLIVSVPLIDGSDDLQRL
jgi:hypothetical protein